MTKPTKDEIARAFKPGDRVRIKERWLGPDYEGIELTVKRVSEVCVYTHPDLSGRVGHSEGESAFVPEDLELLDAGPAREEQPEPAAKAPDPYKLPHDKNPNGYDEKRIAQVMIARDGAHNGKEPSARDRLIAALAAEQRDGEAKSILLKHPHPGRNFALKNHR